MINAYTQEFVFAVCDKIAPKFKLEPLLIKAICLQESARDQNGLFRPDIARLEQRYYRKYVEKQKFDITTEILLSASYGIMQIMGLSLKEMNYFKWYYEQSDIKHLLENPLSWVAVPKALNELTNKIEWQIEWGCKWFNTKLKLANGDIPKALCYWNGDMSGKYSKEVLAKKASISS